MRDFRKPKKLPESNTSLATKTLHGYPHRMGSVLRSWKYIRGLHGPDNRLPAPLLDASPSWGILRDWEAVKYSLDALLPDSAERLRDFYLPCQSNAGSIGAPFEMQLLKFGVAGQVYCRRLFEVYKSLSGYYLSCEACRYMAQAASLTGLGAIEQCEVG